MRHLKTKHMLQGIAIGVGLGLGTQAFNLLLYLVLTY